MTARIFLKLIAAVFAVLAVALCTVDFVASGVVENTYIGILKTELHDKALMIASIAQRYPGSLDQKKISELGHIAGGRITWVGHDGRVLADSEADPNQMENHRTRPEVARALRGAWDSSVRRSNTLGIDFLYVATPLDGGVLRLALPLNQVYRDMRQIRIRMLGFTALGFIPATFFAAFIARRYSTKLGMIIEYAHTLATGNFKARLNLKSRGELGVLGDKLEETGRKLQAVLEALEREHLELEKLERVRKDFVSNVSHELRTPLASIQGYAETLLDGAIGDPENNVRFVKIIHQNAERLSLLTADLLTLSRIEQKRQNFQPAAYLVNSLLKEAVENMHPLAQKKEISIGLEPAREGTEIFCDYEALQQILSNLIDNAIKYTPEGGRITVSALEREPASAGKAKMIEIAVADTGIGIPAEDLPRLFERFYRVDKARSRAVGGTGLGLAIVKHLVLAQGGEVWVTSEFGKGSVFHFSLPVEGTGTEEIGPVQSAVTSM